MRPFHSENRKNHVFFTLWGQFSVTFASKITVIFENFKFEISKLSPHLTNTPKNIPYEFGDLTHTKTCPTINIYIAKIDIFPVFSLRHDQTHCTYIGETSKCDIFKTRRS